MQTDLSCRQPIDVALRPQDRVFIRRGIKSTAGPFDRRLPQQVLGELALLHVEGDADHVHRNLISAGFRHQVVEPASSQRQLIVTSVREDHHEITGRIQEVERLEQIEADLEALQNRRAPIVEPAPLLRIAHQLQAEQNVFIVGRERCHHVRFVAELDERKQVAIRAAHSQSEEVLGRRHRREEGRTALRVQLCRLELHRHAR